MHHLANDDLRKILPTLVLLFGPKYLKEVSKFAEKHNVNLTWRA
jgi:hypothetical protein